MKSRFLGLMLGSIFLFTACFKAPFEPRLSNKQAFVKGLALFDAGNYKGAKKYFQKVVNALPDSTLFPKALFLYGESLFHLKDYSLASQQYSRLAYNFSKDSLAAFAQLKIDECYRSQFRQALKLFRDEDYLDARNELKVIILSSRSPVIDSARFFYAETFYQTKEYILAISEYERLIKFYSRSPLVDDSQFKMAMSYYKLSPKYSLDQDYTYKAQTEFQRFLDEFPQSDLRPEVEKNFLECRSKLAKKEYKTGDLYRKMGEYEAAIISYQKLLSTFYDTPFAPEALYWKAVCLRQLDQLRDAKEDFTRFIEKYPNHSLYHQAKKGLEAVTEELNDRAAIDAAKNETPK